MVQRVPGTHHKLWRNASYHVSLIFLLLVMSAPRLTFVVFLVRALLKVRSGVQRSDLIVKFLVRNVVQTAALATIWAIVALVAWFWVKSILVYRIFDITSGTVYTHVSLSSLAGLRHLKENNQAIFETLICRTQLRDRMASTSAYVDFSSTQVRSYFDSPNVWLN
jgi:hypothetical protein